MKRVGANIDLANSEICFASGSEQLKFLDCKDINFLRIDYANIPSAVRNSFQKVIEMRKKAFADLNESLPYNTNIVATIRTEDNDPIYSKLYPYPMGVANVVNEEIKSYLAHGIIRPSRSPYNNPVWIVDKKGVDEMGNRKKRLVIDFRKLNQRTIDDKYPIPNVMVILSNMGKARYFTTLDLKSGFHQIELAERNREKTAFSVNNGKYEFCRLPFGLKNAPSIFQRAIDDVLREEIGRTCHVYVDDVIIFSETKEDHVKHIDWVLRKLCEANMRISKEKSNFFKTSVEYLGFVVSRGGIQTSPSKVDAIKNYPTPTTLFGIRSFLGLASYYRCFIKDFDLTTDASSSGLGAVLSQNGKPIIMISRTLKDNEMHLATNERELLAIVWALKNPIIDYYNYIPRTALSCTYHRSAGRF